MKKFSCVGASGGIAIGPVHIVAKADLRFEKTRVADIEGEVARFEIARTMASEQLGALALSTAEKLGKQNSLIFEIHQMMLEDTDYGDSVCGMIRSEAACAEYAVSETAERLSKEFAEAGNEYMRARAPDVWDISRRVIENLTGAFSGSGAVGPAVFVSDEFTPSETAQFERGAVLALLAARGVVNSHMAIFARTLGIPAVVGLGGAIYGLREGDSVIVDGAEGVVIFDPTSEVLEEYRGKQDVEIKTAQRLKALKGKPNLTRGGRHIDICANIGSVKDAELAIENDAGGIGLFRSEFLYLESDRAPDEDTQFEAYKAVLQKMEGKRVVIRTLDIGADKKAPYLNLDREENPALGYRALRICLDRLDIFLPQLRALYRASVYGKLAIMFPMVTSVDEVIAVKWHIKTVQEDLSAAGIPFSDKMEIGIMIETPAAALISKDLAKEVDFFSVGTNDLTQYTLAADRQNSKIEKYINPYHEGIFTLIEMAARNIHNEGKWIGVCGELAADRSCTGRFLDMGIDELSVSPAHILPLRETVRGLAN